MLEKELREIRNQNKKNSQNLSISKQKNSKEINDMKSQILQINKHNQELNSLVKKFKEEIDFLKSERLDIQEENFAEVEVLTQKQKDKLKF